MASNYVKNKWELYNPALPNEEQPHSFITKRKLEVMEQGIENANISLEIGEVVMSEDDSYGVNITEDVFNKTKKLNVKFPKSNQAVAGQDGKSAYDIWLEAGHTGTVQEFLDYLKGANGKDGKDGKDGQDGEAGPAGQSAYQIWIAQGNTGTELDFLNTLKGNKGEDGKSAYELWKLLDENTNKSITEFFDSLKGERGPAGNTEFVDFNYDEI